MQLAGATVTTSGAGSTGLVVHGATSSLSASGVTVITTGEIDPATGDHAVGADNAPYLPGGVSSGGFISLTNSAIQSDGAGATGVVTEAGGSTTLIGTNVSTAGPGAPGVFTDAGGVTNVREPNRRVEAGATRAHRAHPRPGQRKLGREPLMAS